MIQRKIITVRFEITFGNDCKMEIMIIDNICYQFYLASSKMSLLSPDEPLIRHFTYPQYLNKRANYVAPIWKSVKNLENKLKVEFAIVENMSKVLELQKSNLVHANFSSMSFCLFLPTYVNGFSSMMSLIVIGNWRVHFPFSRGYRKESSFFLIVKNLEASL